MKNYALLFTRPTFALALALALPLLPFAHAQQAVPPAPAGPAALPSPPSAVPPLEQKFRDGLYAEEATLDLDTAAKAYAEIIAAFDRDRATAASALFRLGEVHRKQNRPAEAIACFRRLLHEFADREPLARLAAENLKALGAAPPDAGPAPTAGPVQDISLEESQELARLQGMLKNSPDLLHLKTGGPDGKGVSPFIAALRAGHLKVTEFLLANGADPNRTPEGSNPLADAALGGHKALAELLLAKGADINGTGSGNANPVVTAIQGNAATVLKLLIERGADLKKAGAVIAAVNQNKSAMLKLLLDAGADPNEGIARQTRIGDGNKSTLDGLEKYLGFTGGTGRGKGVFNEQITDGYTPLQAACALRNPANAALLLQKGAEVNAKSTLGSTALEVAVVTSQPELIDVLLKAGADPKHIAPGGLRLTDLAAAFRNVASYQLLRKAGAEAAGLNPAGQSIWQILAPWLAHGHEGTDALANALLADGVEFNSLPDLTNPLVIAVRSRNLPLTKLCLAHGGIVKRDGRMPLILHLVGAALDRIGSRPGVSAAGQQSKQLFSGSEMEILGALVQAGADIDEVYQSGDGLYRWQGLTALHLLALNLGNFSMASLEQFLSFHPNPHVRTASYLETPGPLKIAYELSSGMKNLPIHQRLWDYTWLENTPDRERSAWINQPVFGTQNTSTMASFVSIAPGNIAEVIVHHLAKGGRLPDAGKLAIHRIDPTTGKTSRTEPLDLMALASQGDTAKLPTLHPGDILDLPTQKMEGIASWRELPAPLPDFLRKATTRRITLTAGNWKRTFQVRPPLEGFRWDPSTDILSVEPCLASLLRFTPQPDFTYRMNAVAVKRAGQAEPQLLDLQASPEAGQKLILADGDEIVLTSLPPDDPALKERLTQGIFVSRPKDGFLREVLRNTGAPPEIENKVTVDDIRELSLAASAWVLPKPVRDPILNGEPWPSNGPLVWGQTLETPRDMAAEGIPWTGSSPKMPASLPWITLIRRDAESFPLALYRRNSIFQLQEDGWSVRSSPGTLLSAVSAPAWYIGDRSLAALADEIAPDKSRRGVWELQSPRLKEPLRIDLRDKEPPFILLESDDILIVERDELLLDLKSTNGTPPRPAPVASPPPPAPKRVVLPITGQ